MTKKERFQFVIDYFEHHAPDAETELLYDNPYQLLVAVILSAQCTDKRVNMTTPAIFQQYPDIPSLATATFDELFPLSGASATRITRPNTLSAWPIWSWTTFTEKSPPPSPS